VKAGGKYFQIFKIYNKLKLKYRKMLLLLLLLLPQPNNKKIATYFHAGILLSLFDPDDGGDKFLRNFS
jgi:hypothetical protein